MEAFPFDFWDAIDFLAAGGCDRRHIIEGSMPLSSLQFGASQLDVISSSAPLLLLQIGTFVGVSLAFFASYLAKRSCKGTLISVDPNLPHRGISHPTSHALRLLQRYSLLEWVCIVEGYSLEKAYSNDRITFEGYDPVRMYEGEYACPDQLLHLERVARRAVDCVIIDGNHDPNYLSREIDVSSRLLKPGGLLLVDDIDWPALRQAWDRASPDTWVRVADDGRIGVLRLGG